MRNCNTKNEKLEEKNKLQEDSLQVKTQENEDLKVKNRQLSEENLTVKQRVEQKFYTGMGTAVIVSDEQKKKIMSGTSDNSIKHNETGPTINK